MAGDKKTAKPFLKWAGGKTQLIPFIESGLPKELHNASFTYVEPFVGSGAVLFWFLRNFSNINTVVINDINKDLTDTYLTVKLHPEALIEYLEALEKKYFSLKTVDQQKKFFLKKRALFNSRNNHTILQSALMIFLNRTCFNGLYRVNSKNEFNVPLGRYTNPTICDEENIYNASAALQRVTILNGDYAATLQHVTGKAFFYFDPPYKPLSKTALFNSYSSDIFSDNEQVRLKEFCDKLNKKNIKWMLSNSDPRNTNSNNHFFDELYEDYFIDRVKAKRRINAAVTRRGEISELLIRNYKMQKV